MRSGTGWHHRLARELSDAWPASLGDFSPKAMLDVELAFYLLARVLPGLLSQGRVDPLWRLPVCAGSRPRPHQRGAAAHPPRPPLPVDYAPPGLVGAGRALPGRATGAPRLPTGRPRRGTGTAVARPRRRALRDVREPARLAAAVQPPSHPAGHRWPVPVPGSGPELRGHLRPVRHPGRPAGRPRPRPRPWPMARASRSP